MIDMKGNFRCGWVILLFTALVALAFKNEDADNKQERLLLVVALVLIAFPGFVEALKMLQ